MNLLIYLELGKVTNIVAFMDTKLSQWVNSKAGLIKNRPWAGNEEPRF